MTNGSKSNKTANETDMGPPCMDCDHKHCGHIQPANILVSDQKEFTDPELSNPHPTNMSFVSESNKTANKPPKKCKRCPNPQCGVMQRSNVVKNCKACKHKFVFKNKNPNSRQGKSNKICGGCGKEARSNNTSHCKYCDYIFPSGHKTENTQIPAGKKSGKKSGKKRGASTKSSSTRQSKRPRTDETCAVVLNVRQSSIEPVWDTSTISLSPSLSRQSSLEPVWDTSTISLSRQSSLDFSGYSQIPTDNVKVLTTKEDEDSMLGLGVMQDNINVWMQDIHNQIDNQI